MNERSGRTRQFVVIGAIGLCLFGPGAYQCIRLSLVQRRLERTLAELAVRHEQLLQEQARLQSDPTYVEGLIRSTFKVAKPGEYVIPLDSTRSQE